MPRPLRPTDPRRVSRHDPGGTVDQSRPRHSRPRTPTPKGVTTYVTGPSVLVSDMHHSGDSTLVKITMVTMLVIFDHAPAGLSLGANRGVAPAHGLRRIDRGARNSRISGLLPPDRAFDLRRESLDVVVIAAATDYAIFFFGRYHEARHLGADREAAFYTMYRGIAHVVLASGPDDRGATFCLHFTRHAVFPDSGCPLAIGMFVAVAVALTLVPAMIVVGGRFGLFDPKRKIADPWLATGRHRDRPLAGPILPRPSRWRWSVCWPCRDTRPATTTGCSFRKTSRPTRDSTPPNDISPRPG